MRKKTTVKQKRKIRNSFHGYNCSVRRTMHREKKEEVEIDVSAQPLSKQAQKTNI